MKKIIATVAILATVFCSMKASVSGDESLPISIIISQTVKDNSSSTIKRSVVNGIDAIWYPQEEIISIECYDEGLVTYALFDDADSVIAEGSFDSGLCDAATLMVPENSGTYYLVVESEMTYGYGVLVCE